MPDELEGYIDACHYRFSLLSSQILLASYWFKKLGDMIGGQYWSSAENICDTLSLIFVQIDVDLSRDLPSVNYYLDKSLNYINENVPWDAGVVTWQTICEAWVANDFEARFWTIGIIDRMRQILWDEPFDLTWAARPEDREIV